MVTANTMNMMTVVEVLVHNSRSPIAATLNKIMEKMNVCFCFILYARLVIIILGSERATAHFPLASRPSYYSSLHPMIAVQSKRWKQHRR